MGIGSRTRLVFGMGGGEEDEAGKGEGEPGMAVGCP